MTSYKLIKIMNARKLGRKKLKVAGSSLNPKLKGNPNFIEVNKIIISNYELAQNTLIHQFHFAYRRLFKLVMDNLESDDASQSDTKLALNETMKMQKIIEDKYKQKITNQNYQAMQRKVNILEQKLKEKLMIQENIRKMLQNKPIEEEKGRGR